MPSTIRGTTYTSLSVREQTMDRRPKWPAIVTTSKGRKFIIGVGEIFHMPVNEKVVSVDMVMEDVL